MTVKECGIESGRSDQTIRWWIKKRGLKAKKKGFKELSISPEDWKDFCDEHGIERRGES